MSKAEWKSALYCVGSFVAGALLARVYDDIVLITFPLSAAYLILFVAYIAKFKSLPFFD
jgi:hypothetical protein